MTNKRKQLKQIENQSQSGRSMVEMLGVLAIIAVLSIGGIIMFRYAMNYYQANQIAHEMNMMRTDAQIKIAQGTEKLTLGSPYDSGNIQFNGYKTNFDCLDMETETSIPDKVVSCAVANAYYIELKEIPEGVCKPLANLIDNMDNEIAFYINGKSVDATAGEKGACGEGNNKLTVVFGADSDSNAVKCDTEDDCPIEQHICHKHVCVECEDNGDCKNPDEPKCEESTHTCEPCPPEKPIWYNNTCVECTTNDDCLKNGTESPICNTGTNTCEPCPEDQPWNGEFCGCLTNNNCESDEFCLTSDCYCICGDDTDAYRSGTTTEQDCCTDKPHKCVKVSEYTAPNLDSNDSPYIMSNIDMNWWSAERFCQALPGSKHMLKFSDLDCCDDSLGGTTQGYCYAKEDTCSDANGFSHVIKKLRQAENGSEDQGNNLYWLEEPYTDASKGRDSCGAYIVALPEGSVFGQNRGNYHPGSGGDREHRALCW